MELPHKMSFFAMGGYAPYVWGAYGFALAVLLLMLALALRLARKAARVRKQAG